MLQSYSSNVTIASETAIPFDNVTTEKGCTVCLTSPSTLSFNKCGVYMVACNASSAANATIQLFKDGVAQPQAISTGLSPSFTTLVQVDHNNCGCCCSSPVIVQIRNMTDAESNFTNCNVVVTKVC